MTEQEAVWAMAGGCHPGNLIEGAPLLLGTGPTEAMEREYLRLAREERPDWYRFHRLIRMWFVMERRDTAGGP